MVQFETGEALTSPLFRVEHIVKRWQFWLGLVVSAVFLWLALRGLKLDEVIADLRTANYAWLLPGVAVYFIGVLARTWRWHYLLQPLKPVPLARLFPVVVIGYMGNNIYPARAGELLRAYVLKRNEGISASASLATVIVERIFDGVVMLLFVFVSLPAAQSAWNVPDSLRVIVFGGSLLFFSALIVFLWLAARPATAARVYSFFIDRLLPGRFRAPVHGLLDRFMTGLAGLRSLRHMLMIFLTTLLIWLLETTMYWFVTHAFAFEVPFVQLMLLNGVINLATTIPALPGYVGTLELTSITVLMALGVDQTRATSFTVVLHAALWLPITLLGLYFMARESLRWSDLRRAAASRDVETAGT